LGAPFREAPASNLSTFGTYDPYYTGSRSFEDTAPKLEERGKRLDHLLEFKHLRWEELDDRKSGVKNTGMRELPRKELRQLPPMAKKLTEAETQLVGYRETLERVYGERLRLWTHAVVCVGLERLVW